MKEFSERFNKLLSTPINSMSNDDYVYFLDAIDTMYDILSNKLKEITDSGRVAHITIEDDTQ